MDRHCGDISLGLYRLERTDGTRYRVHTYSSRPEAGDRLAHLRRAMAALGGTQACEDASDWQRFACGADHEQACRRLFLEAAKLDTGDPVAQRPLTVFDRKSDGYYTAVSQGDGSYRVAPDSGDRDSGNPGAGDREESLTRRSRALAAGLAKLALLDRDPSDEAMVSFACGHRHDELVGLLLVRALNVRAALREQEESASKGVLAAPGSQE